MGSLSGAGTQWGIGTQRGITLAIDEINAAGGLKVGATTYTLKMIMYDDQGTAQGGTTAATRLMEVDGVKFIVGAPGSPSALGVIGVTGPAKVIALTDGFSNKILNADSKYNFRIEIPTEYFAPNIVHWLRKTYPEAKKVGFISPNDAIGQTLVPVYSAVYKEAGFETASNDMFERGLTDFTPLITRLMSRGVDIFELDGNSPGDAGLMVRQARQLGYKGVIIQTGAPGSADEIVRVAGSFAEGFLAYDRFDPTAQAAQAFVAQYHARFEGPINGTSPPFYNATQLLTEALRRAGTVDVDKVRDQIEKLDGFPSLYGPVQWGGQDRYGIRHQLLIHDLFVWQVKNGQLVLLARVSAAN